MKRIFLLILIFSTVIFITGCNKESAETIDIRGEIKEIHTDEEGLLIQSILVEGEIEDDTLYDSAIITISNGTKILKENEEVEIEVVEEGLIVEVIFDGSVAESYPVQATAKEITIIEN
ncbi:DUF3221 domain-containing protein [Clostridium sp. Cult1]|jgi:hypothetical protein|uniref:DUF3221 domain-containing protein n=1 Tax=Clostridium sp. Cult1 TaxID=2079002 RepID=UPI001F334C07|nr:DUF3221 domain-containing protein [Clostridium sp. Cult1]MCF6462651.1 DUF3221 domain-containing protein [Clostridium sp. Cult1]